MPEMQQPRPTIIGISMSTRFRLALLPAILMSFITVVGAWAQSLADIAKAEERRRGAVAQPSKVYTNADIGEPPEGSPHLATPPILPTDVFNEAPGPTVKLFERVTTENRGEGEATVEWREVSSLRESLARCQQSARVMSDATLEALTRGSNRSVSVTRYIDKSLTVRIGFIEGTRRYLDWLCLPTTAFVSRGRLVDFSANGVGRTTEFDHADTSQSVRRPTPGCATCPREADGSTARSEAARREFMRQTNFPKGRSGYVIDHIVPLACGGADDPRNMQWQTIEEAKGKDRTERKGCQQQDRIVLRVELEQLRAQRGALQERVDQLAQDFVGRSDPAQRAVIERERQGAIRELQGLDRAIADAVRVGAYPGGRVQ